MGKSFRWQRKVRTIFAHICLIDKTVITFAQKHLKNSYTINVSYYLLKNYTKLTWKWNEVY